MNIRFTRVTMSWQSAPKRGVNRGQEWLEQARKIRAVVKDHPLGPDSELWWNPSKRRAWINEGDAATGDHRKLAKQLVDLGIVHDVQTADEARPAGRQEAGWVKVAMPPRALGEVLQFLPAQYLKGIPSAPSPLAASLAGGVLGAAAGYGAGWLGEKLLPDDWQRNNLRRSLMLAGGLGGAAPGFLWGLTNLANKRSLLDSGPFTDDGPAIRDNRWPAANEVVKEAMGPLVSRTSMLGGPELNVDHFNNVIWHDPYVSNQLSPRVQAAASGAVLGAASLAGDGDPTRYITPVDMARFSLGMGSGYLSGALLGSMAGKMLGAPDHVQDTLKRTGVFAGLIANLVPRVFGG